MASENAKKIVLGRMKWDGESPDNLPPVAERTKLSRRQWAEQQYLWGRRVRRDILVLEKLLVDNKIISASDLYVPADPGDPPPPPDEI